MSTLLTHPAAAPLVTGYGRIKRFYFAYRPAIVLSMGLYLVLLHLIAFVYVWKSDTPGVIAWHLGLGSRWAELNTRYHGRTGLLKRRAEAATPGAVFFIGDSQVGTLDVSSIADRAVELAIGGDTARGVASRLEDYPLENARLVFFHVGTNDLNYRKPEELRRIYERLLRTVPAKVDVVFSAILPVDERIFHKYDNATILAANRVMADVCKTRPNCRYIDSGRALMDGTGGLDPRLHRGDGLHPTAEGYRRWAATIAPYLDAYRRL